MNDKDYDTIKKEIVINASVDKVYSALIDPEQLAQWFPNIATMEPRVGGKIFFRFSKEVTKKKIMMLLEQSLVSSQMKICPIPGNLQQNLTTVKTPLLPGSLTN
jgi:hypothetical protein